MIMYDESGGPPDLRLSHDQPVRNFHSSESGCIRHDLLRLLRYERILTPPSDHLCQADSIQLCWFQVACIAFSLHWPYSFTEPLSISEYWSTRLSNDVWAIAQEFDIKRREWRLCENNNCKDSFGTQLGRMHPVISKSCKPN
jgi:hypothetical protein